MKKLMTYQKETWNFQIEVILQIYATSATVTSLVLSQLDAINALARLHILIVINQLTSLHNKYVIKKTFYLNAPNVQDKNEYYP